MLPFLVPVLFTFYIQGLLKKLKKFGCQKVKIRDNRWRYSESNVPLALAVDCQVSLSQVLRQERRVILYCNHQVHRDFLITLYYAALPCTEGGCACRYLVDLNLCACGSWWIQRRLTQGGVGYCQSAESPISRY
jgi:hypothetical protein